MYIEEALHTDMEDSKAPR